MKEPLETVTGAGHRLGEYIRDQRKGSQISLRQLATLAGVSNPYLSQIERGLRRPSAEILQQIAKGLRISAEALYLQAGILEHRGGDGLVVDAVLADGILSERQKQVLLEIYDSFCKESGALAATTAAASDSTVDNTTVDGTADNTVAAGDTTTDDITAGSTGAAGMTRSKAAGRRGRTATPRAHAGRNSTTPTTPQEATS